MNFSQLLDHAVTDVFGRLPWLDGAKYWAAGRFTFLDGSLMMFLPELVLCGTILLLLFVRLFNGDRVWPGQGVALIGAFLSLLTAVAQFSELCALRDPTIQGGALILRQEFFGGLLIYDQFTVFFRLFLLLFLVLVVFLTRLSGIPDVEDAPDFYSLLIGSTLGMLLMASANHLLVLFLGIEMTSVPSYAMVGFLKGRRKSSEAALKYVVYGGGAAGVMLYGVSLLAGLLGTASLPELGPKLFEVLQHSSSIADPTARTVALAILMVLVGISFKLSLFPFHFWCPDAFEGASAEVAGYLSVASKGAAFALLVRFLLGLLGGPTEYPEQIAKAFTFLGVGLGAIAAATATFGNLAAYGQTNMKRMLAYSTIAHAGYMLMPVAAMVVILAGSQASAEARMAQGERCLEALLYYLWVYLFMNLGAFAVVALIRNEIFSEDIADYAGLMYQAPVLVVSLALCLFSLVGLPPLGGFYAKLLVFMALFQAGHVHWAMWAVLVLAGLNTVFSLFYYVRVLKIMIIDPLPDGARRFRFPLTTPAGVFVSLLGAVVFASGVIVQPWTHAARDVATIFFR